MQKTLFAMADALWMIDKWIPCLMVEEQIVWNMFEQSTRKHLWPSK
jgi:hypothetical protein